MILLLAPGGILLVRWTLFRDAWVETALSLVLGGLAFGLWWGLYGRTLPAPQGSQIRVHREDDETT
jgi:hypothetical protein